jgi:hypothetical protein
MQYGEQYITYGASRPCARCGIVHSPSAGIRESSQSRFMLMQLLAEIAYNKSKNFNIAGNQEPRLLGIQITPVAIYAAQSGDWQQGHTQFLLGALGKGYRICPPRRPDMPGNIDASGRPITPQMYRSTNRVGNGGYPPGNCAAPRLIQQAIHDHRNQGRRINPTRWSMSEVMYKLDPAEVPPNGRQDWVHGLTAFSCETCARLVPTLLCTDHVWSENNVLPGFMTRP